MELAVAIRLIERGVKQTQAPQVWADLGSGKGLFTQALSSLLPDKSKIYAVDKDRVDLPAIESEVKQITIEKIRKDFVYDELGIELLDGIVIANALHFVEKRDTFASTIRRMLKPSGRVILIEYDTDRSNPWVPYPISFNTLIRFANVEGFNEVVKLDEEPSIYDRADLYSALLTR